MLLDKLTASTGRTGFVRAGEPMSRFTTKLRDFPKEFSEEPTAMRLLVEAAFDATSGRLVRLVWRQSGVERTYRYGDHFEPLPGLVLPRQVEILQGGRRVERVTIDTFDARTRPGSGRFDPPGT